MSSSPVDEIEVATSGEGTQVVCWRAQKLIGAGVPYEVAWRIAAELTTDISSALPKLAGCPPELIALILE